MSSTAGPIRWDVTAFNARAIEEFRANRGIVPSLPQRTPLVLLTTTEAKTDRKRTVPLASERFDDRYYVVGAVLGPPRHPRWYPNVPTDPRVTVEVGGDRFDITARILQGPARFASGDC